ncbi:MAG: hypothetical protein JW742_05200 [Candidatus Aminicenantes bacterium]|nr:hypothetical protein [Candidatus Aminicenantes bacterium]
MKKTGFGIVLMFAALQPLVAQVASLSHVFQAGKGLRDSDGDGWPDRVALQVVLSDDASAVEAALAADIAARANLESLAVDMGLVRRESELAKAQGLDNLILIGTGTAVAKELLKSDRRRAALGPSQGLVFVFSAKAGRRGVAVIGGSEDALLRTGRAFFLRWPYFWDVWGREDGPTYFSLERDIERFLGGEGIGLQRTILASALYGFPLADVPGDLGRTFAFETGGIERLQVEIHFADGEDLEKAFRALDLLRVQRAKGIRTAVLSYPGCGSISFELRYGKTARAVELPRLGAPLRVLTPRFKEEPARDVKGKDFDLASLFSTRGVFGDVDKDTVADDVESTIVIPSDRSLRSLSCLSSRLVLDTAGASFPLVLLDREVERAKALPAPILVGDNALNRELLRTAKLKPLPLEPGQASVQVVAKAFGSSNALSIVGPDDAAVEKALSYLGRTFPYFAEFRAGAPSLRDVPADLDGFLKGERGAAEAFLSRALDKAAADLKGKDLESVEVELDLPRRNAVFADWVRTSLASSLKADEVKVESKSLKDGVPVFAKEKAFPWEAETALAVLEEALASPPAASRLPVKVSLGLSESPAVRRTIRKRTLEILAAAGVPAGEVEVASAYKPGFFWLTEEILPALKDKAPARLVVAWSREQDDFSRPKRFYADPARWLQELYPADEILSRELGLPVERVEFEMKPPGGPAYRATAFDGRGAVVLDRSFTPRTREIPFLGVLPEWGTVRVTTGWIVVQEGSRTLVDRTLATDLETFWEYYQSEILPAVYGRILEKTGSEPTFSKQPYFKRLQVELWLSEPDERIGLDEEMVSSLEAIHDEIYFDTLDFLRGITRFDPDDKDVPEDTSRYSAPGNVLPVLHPSLEGRAGRARVSFEDWPAAAPRMVLRWKERGRDALSKTVGWPSLKVKPGSVLALVHDGRESRVAGLTAVLDCESEPDYLTLVDVLQSYRELLERGLLVRSFDYPSLRTLTLRLKTKDLEKDEVLALPIRSAEEPAAGTAPGGSGASVPDDEILSYEKTWAIVRRLSERPGIQAYSGGLSFEGREIPVLEITTPREAYASVPRLTAFKPTLHINARQHANEVAGTNYSLMLAERLIQDKAYADYPKRMNIVIQPMENPDGAETAFALQALTPHHSLHAGRYGALGIEIGGPAPPGRPVAPEAAVRKAIAAAWRPDVFLNLHGYPSHEWVQPFSGYAPYLFRDYWIPRGWYAYFSALRHPLFGRWGEAGAVLQRFLIEEMEGNERIRASNKKFYDRYERWASRWQPVLADLELYDGLNIYAKRRSSREARPAPGGQTLLASETPEVMDETARGPWLKALCEQGLAYLRAHLRYLAQAKPEVGRIEEEVRGRIRVQFYRSRPPTAAPSRPGDAP